MIPTDDDKRKATDLAQELWAQWIDYEADNGQDWEPLAMPILAEALSSARAQGAAEAMRWRAVNAGELPKLNASVIGYDQFYSRVGEAFYTGRKNDFGEPSFHFVDSDDCHITHWMPMPEQPASLPPPPPPEKKR